MLVQKEFLNKLKDFGLNSYEAKLWTALLSRGSSTAGELSDIAGVPRSRTYDVLESLEKKGFILVKPGKPISYVAVPPEEVIERIKRKIEDSTKVELDLIRQLKGDQLMTELNQLYGQGFELLSPTDLTGSVKGRNNIHNHLESMIKNAKKSIIIATTHKGALRKTKALLEALKQAHTNGVKIKILVPAKKILKNTLKEVTKIAEVKNCDIKTRVCIVDSREMMFMLKDDENVHPSYDAGIWVNTEYFAGLLDRILQKTC